LTQPFAHFLTSDSGAVTVDWVVLAAATVGLGVASVAAVRTGTGSLGQDIANSLASASVATWGSEPSWQNEGITNGLCPGAAALEASYNSLIAAGEDFEGIIAQSGTGPYSESYFAVELTKAQTISSHDAYTDEFVTGQMMVADGEVFGSPETTFFMAQWSACAIEAGSTDWSTAPGGSFEGFLMDEYGFQLPAG
jgi:hypothetical protein